MRPTDAPIISQCNASNMGMTPLTYAVNAESPKEQQCAVRIDRLLNQDRISRVHEGMYSLDTRTRVNQTETEGHHRQRQARG